MEVNPVGQWLDLEVDAGHPVSETLARLLRYGPDVDAEATAAPLDEPALQEVQRVQHAAYVEQRLATLQA